MINAEIVSKTTCPFCTKAKKFLSEKNANIFEKTIGVDYTREELLARVPGTKTVPQIWIDGEHIGGYEELIKWFD